MGVLILFLSLAFVNIALGILLLFNWLVAIYLGPEIEINIWWSMLVFSIVPIASFFLKRYFRKNMRKESWKLKGIAWIVFGVCFLEWLLGLLIINLAELTSVDTVIDTRSVIVIGVHLFSMILFYRLSQRIR